MYRPPRFRVETAVRKQEHAMGFDPPTIAQAIEVIVCHRPGITEMNLARAIFGPEAYQQRVNSDCTWMTNAGYILRDDSTGPARYFPGPPGPPGSRDRSSA
jgi:hypothetical protein